MVSSLSENKAAKRRGNLGEVEAHGPNNTMKKHRLFMNAEEVKSEICRLFIPDQRNALEGFLGEDPKTSYLSKVFHNFDLRCLLSTAYISDPMLESYWHILTVSQSDVFVQMFEGFLSAWEETVGTL